MPAHEIGRQLRQSVDLVLGPAVFDRHISMLEKADLIQALSKCSHEFRAVTERSTAQNTDHRDGRLLRTSREWPRRGAANDRDEVAPVYLIQSHSLPLAREPAYRIGNRRVSGS